MIKPEVDFLLQIKITNALLRYKLPDGLWNILSFKNNICKLISYKLLKCSSFILDIKVMYIFKLQNYFHQPL